MQQVDVISIEKKYQSTTVEVLSHTFSIAVNDSIIFVRYMRVIRFTIMNEKCPTGHMTGRRNVQRYLIEIYDKYAKDAKIRLDNINVSTRCNIFLR